MMRAAALSLLSVSLLMTACTQDNADLEQRVAAVKAIKTTQIDPIPQIKVYTAVSYEPGGRRDPFVVEEEPTQTRISTGPSPDLNRNREALEEYPLDALRMAGTIQTREATFVLVKAPDGVIHRVTVGNYLGQNYGKIKAINEAEVSIAELVPDGFGGWVPRPASLALSE